jgi:Fe2+ transport system protein FeoA
LLKKKPTGKTCALSYPEPGLCPLNHLVEGASGRVKRLASTPEVNRRLREMGVFEDQQVKMLARPANIICQVCNTRLGISDEVAGSILVEPVASQKKTPRP